MTGASHMILNLEQKLIDTLQREVAIYEELLDIITREKEALIAFSTFELECCTSSQDSLVSEATELEFTRRSTVRMLAKERGVEGENFTLAEVVDWLSAQHAEQVRSLGERLRDLFTEIARLQDENASLIEGATHQIRRTVDTLMTKSKENPFAYSKGGGKAKLKETIPGLLDRKA